LATEMETAALYTLAAGHGVQGLSILTVSDNIMTGQSATSEQRQEGYSAMMEIALAAAAV
jgi:purine-nucleoside phosphorylase